MAIIRSSVFSEVRGSIGGTTYARNRYGAYARNRTVPVNPRTDAQQAIRAAMATAAIVWKSLTDGERTLWNNYAAATPVTNRLGETIYLSGQAMYNKYSTFYTYQGETVPNSPPASPGLAEPLFAAGVTILDSGSTPPNAINFDFSNGSTNVAALYPAWISAPQSAGKTFFKGPWIYLGKKLGTTRAAEYTIPFAVTAGQVFFTRQGYLDENGKLANDLIQGPIVAVNEP